jgi:hypothetical protein
MEKQVEPIEQSSNLDHYNWKNQILKPIWFNTIFIEEENEDIKFFVLDYI